MTRRQLVLLALNGATYNEYGKINVPGLCSAERRRARHLLGFSQTSKLMISKCLGTSLKHLALQNRHRERQHLHVALFLLPIYTYTYTDIYIYTDVYIYTDL